jgi:hypothetical protein
MSAYNLTIGLVKSQGTLKSKTHLKCALILLPIFPNRRGTVVCRRTYLPHGVAR